MVDEFDSILADRDLACLVSNGQTGVLRAALASGAVRSSNVFVRQLRRSLLAAAVSAEHGDMVRMLLAEHGADANRHFGQLAPLSVAVRAGAAPIVQTLLDYGADVHAAGAQALFDAIAAQRVDLVRLLLAARPDAASSAASSTGALPLHAAARINCPAIIQLLLLHGADATAREPDGSLPLHWAARHAAGFAAVRLLVDAGCDVNAVCAVHLTPLMRVASPLSARLLLQRGALLDAVDVDGWTPLFWSLMAPNQEPVLRVLLGAGARLDVRSVDGDTPLLRAVKWGHTASVCCLLACGADPNLPDARHRTPLSVCTTPAIAALLVASGAVLPAGVESDDAFPLLVRASERLLHVERFRMIRERATEICFALQRLHLPALLTVLIIEEACDAPDAWIPMHFKWRLATTVKHPQISTKQTTTTE